MSQANKDVVRRMFTELMNKKNLKAADELFTPSFVSHQPGGTETRGVEGIRQLASMYIAAFPDIQMNIQEQLAEGDKVVTRWSGTGTHKGGLMGIPPTNKKVSITGITINRISGGKIAEEWENFDQMGMMQQLGVAPAPGR